MVQKWEVSSGRMAQTTAGSSSPAGCGALVSGAHRRRPGRLLRLGTSLARLWESLRVAAGSRTDWECKTLRTITGLFSETGWCPHRRIGQAQPRAWAPRAPSPLAEPPRRAQPPGRCRCGAGREPAASDTARQGVLLPDFTPRWDARTPPGPRGRGRGVCSQQGTAIYFALCCSVFSADVDNIRLPKRGLGGWRCPPMGTNLRTRRPSGFQPSPCPGSSSYSVGPLRP